MAPIGIALVGGGIFIKQAHLPAVLATPSLEIKAIYSRSLKSAQDTAALLPTPASAALYSDDEGGSGGYAAVLARADVAGVIIALPIANQPTYVRLALDAGKHVLAEKPIAPDVDQARGLLRHYAGIRAAGSAATWSVAEQFRCMPNYLKGAAEARTLGKVTGFRVIQNFMIKEDNQYYNTDWRKVPTHNHGFLLDAGVHWVASLRMLLGPDEPVETASGLSHTATKHLPPPDTLQGVLRTRSGVSGAFLASCGSTLPALSEFAVACERGSVVIRRDQVTIVRTAATADGKTTEETETVDVDASGNVLYEVQAWAAALQAGVPDPRLAPEEALADLELLLGMLQSAEAGGIPQTLGLQQVGASA
ncbi:hypothetical protein RB601_009135 [Gaeumannomyces tritici]